MTAPHGIIQVGRNYANGSKPAPTSNAQDRRIIQEIFRDLAQYVEGVEVEMLVDSLKDGLAEEGIHSGEMTNLLKFYDGVRDRLVGISGVQPPFRPLRSGDRVTCPTRRAGGTVRETISGVGVVRGGGNGGSIRVEWPEGRDWWYHNREELVLVGEASEQSVLAAAGLVPSIINRLRSRRDEDAVYIPTSTDEDRALVQALLDDARVRAALFNFNDASLNGARESVSEIFQGDFLDGDDIPALLSLYEDATDPQARVKREKRARLAALQAQVAELERDLAA